MRLQQGFTTGEMGFRGQFTGQQSETGDVRFGSKADIRVLEPMSAITPKATEIADIDWCLFQAASAVSNQAPRSVSKIWEKRLSVLRYLVLKFFYFFGPRAGRPDFVLRAPSDGRAPAVRPTGRRLATGLRPQDGTNHPLTPRDEQKKGGASTARFPGASQQ
jgi:hypothetical protein